jgi:hypothetical protein
MTRAVTVTAAVLGNLLRIAQIGYWCEWFCDVVEDYWRGERRRGEP